jgi:DNA-directed RNA polymerase subunit M/transcription elongation factor TFIIS
MDDEDVQLIGQEAIILEDWMSKIHEDGVQDSDEETGKDGDDIEQSPIFKFLVGDGIGDEKEEEKKHVYTSRVPHNYTKKAFREAIVQALSAKYESPKNGEILEKHIYNATITLARLKGIPLKSADKNFQLTYASIAYDTLSSKSSIKDIIEQLKTGKIEWKALQFNGILAARSAEEADHTKDVVEGIHECSDCKRDGKVFNKTRNVQIQTRGGDEGMTTFVTCVMCRKMWKQAN